jgi:hypothetical protein
VTVDTDLRGTLHRTVAEKLSEHLRTIDGNEQLSLDDERALTRSLIAAELRRLAEDAYRDGGRPLESEAESGLADAVFDRVHSLGRLQPYIDNPDLANIHVNGCDNVWLVYRDGTKIRGDPAADSDWELIDIIASAARRAGRRGEGRRPGQRPEAPGAQREADGTARRTRAGEDAGIGERRRRVDVVDDGRFDAVARGRREQDPEASGSGHGKG